MGKISLLFFHHIFCCSQLSPLLPSTEARKGPSLFHPIVWTKMLCTECVGLAVSWPLQEPVLLCGGLYQDPKESQLTLFVLCPKE